MQRQNGPLITAQFPGSRRDFLQRSATVALAAPLLLSSRSKAQTGDGFNLRYIVGSCLYGYARLEDILPEVSKCGATAIDIWPKVHGDQREQLDVLGVEKFSHLLREHGVSLGCITQYKLGPFGLADEIALAKQLGCQTIVTGAVGPAGLTGKELKSAIQSFVEQMKPHLAVAEAHDVTIAIENHGKNLIESPDSLRWLAELRSSERLGIALAPYHLPQDPQLLSELIRELREPLAMFYAWQHGTGCMTAQRKDQELLQMPGRGELDFAPLLAALREINYQGWTEVFMHPFPRGLAILDTTAQVTAEINRARRYLDKQVSSVPR